MSTILLQTGSVKQMIKRFFMPTVVTLLIVACSNSHSIMEQNSQLLRGEAYGNSEFYVNKIAEMSDPVTQQTYRLLAIRKLLEENKVVEAQNMFAELPKQVNDPQQKMELDLLSAQLAALQKNNNQSLAFLHLVNIQQLSNVQAVRYFQIFAKIAENNKDIIEAVNARISINYYLQDNNLRQINNDQIWALLRNANKGMLNQISLNPQNANLAGWVALITIYNQFVSEPTELVKNINQWRLQYPSHIATLLPPTELRNIGNFQETYLTHLALMLPISGDGKILGEMIKKGFDDAKGNAPVSVKVLDTDKTGVAELMNEVKVQGIQSVVGPLLKHQVDELLTLNDIDNINVLALNSTPNVRAVSRVCYYGLSPEAEAHSAADKLYKDGIAKPIVVVPNKDFGQRSADAFALRWQQLTNDDTTIYYYNQPLDVVAKLQGLNIEKGYGLYILGSPDQLLEIKQSLNNISGMENIMVYSSSRSNSSNNAESFRLTMEGVIFSEIPLLADEESEAFKNASKLAQNDYSLMRLYAMGSDAWLLANKFNELRQIPGYSVSGLTGRLSVGANCNIERELTWLKYVNGGIVTAD